MLTTRDDEFDPLADEDESPFDEELTAIGMTEVLQSTNGQSQDLPPSERISSLFASMPSLEPVLFGIIEFCREPRSGGSVNERTADLTLHRYSIYSSVTLRKLLEQAGALEYLAPSPDESAQKIVKEKLTDGIEDYELEYLEITEASEGLWIATEAGLEVVNAHNPQDALRQLLDDDKLLLDVYEKILTFCSQEGGRNISQIDALVADDPRLQHPRKYGGYFVERLEAVEALLYKGTWVTSELGLSVLDNVTEGVRS
jgi:hypothetical protein